MAYRVLSYQSVNQSRLLPTFAIPGWRDQLYVLQDKRENHGKTGGEGIVAILMARQLNGAA